MITVVGLHGGEAFGRAAADALVDAEVVVAAPRHREQLRLAPGVQVHLRPRRITRFEAPRAVQTA